MSYNFNPQPNFSKTSGGLSTASMHTVTPPTISSPFSILGTYQLGAVHLAADAQLSGSSAINMGQFTKAVISFWARYNSTVSNTGSQAIISQSKGTSGGPPPSDSFTVCSANDPITGGIPIQNAGILIGPATVDLFLQDGVTRRGLLKASINWTLDDGNFSQLQWINMGPWSSLIQPPPPGPGTGNGLPGSTYYNGRYWNGTFWAGFFPCGTAPFVIDTTGAANLPQYQSVADLPNPNVPPFISFGSVRTGPTPPFPNTVYDTPADEYAAISFREGGGTPTGGWHHFICSFDTSQIVNDQFGSPVIRAQWAIDRGGGPIAGGPLMDTKAGVPGTQPMYNTSNQSGTTGVLVCNTDDTWTIGAPIDASVDFAYCYMGIVPTGGDFFDLTVPRPDGSSRLNYFITEQLTPENLGFHGQNVPLLCNWMHTGATQPGAGGPYFAVNAADARVWKLSGGTMTATDGPPIGA